VESYALAQQVAGEMINSSVIADFRAVSKKIHDIYMEDFLIGPTGHKFWVDEVNFRSSYPSYLQSYEFSLLAQATLKAIQEFPRSEVVGRAKRDGNVYAVQADEEQSFLDSLSRHLRELGLQLGLAYTQRIEVKSRFPKSIFSTRSEGTYRTYRPRALSLLKARDSSYIPTYRTASDLTGLSYRKGWVQRSRGPWVVNSC